MIFDALVQFLVEAALYRPWAQRGAFILLLIAQILFGSVPERVAGATWVAIVIAVMGTALQIPAPSAVPVAMPSIELLYFVTDLIVWAVFVWLAVSANRMYALWIAALQTISLAAYPLKALLGGPDPFTFYFIIVAPSYGILIAMFLGLLAHMRRQRSGLYYPDWRWQIGEPAPRQG